MHKLLFFVMVCLAIGMSLAFRPDKDPSHFKKKDLSHMNPKPSLMRHKLSNFCSNDTVAQAYLTQILSVIKGLEANSSYNSILKLQLANFITYLKDSINQGLLHSDCEGFFKGLKVAKNADKAVDREQKRLVKAIQQKMKQVARDVTNGNGFNELDS